MCFGRRIVYVFFFFKQKTAYEMRISDWSSDVCSSDLEFARYKDVDGDGIPWRTWPGTHPDKGAYFTRGTSRNPQAQYSERGADYVYNMQRLLQKFDTAKALAPQPVESRAGTQARHGVIFYASTSPAMAEARDSRKSDVEGKSG